MKIGILFGGKSFEHDISIITANTIYQILKDKYDLYLLYINREGLLNYVKKMDIEKFVNGEKTKEFSFISLFTI
jgi:D-alanine-D-alanine ligase-like ATP-grasp enzyme